MSKSKSRGITEVIAILEFNLLGRKQSSDSTFKCEPSYLRASGVSIR
jgi:hypothetical protein